MVILNAKKQLKIDVVTKVIIKKMDRKTACQILSVSMRTLERYIASYNKKGVSFALHGNNGRSPINKTSPELEKYTMKIVKDKYYDFNMSHCLEMLSKHEHINIKRETFRKWSHKANHVKKAKRRKSKARYYRDRMAQTGLLLQMDGSPDRWFGGKQSCLITAIDDASSEIPYAEFFPAEDTISCMVVLQKIIEAKGVFKVLYVDRAGIYGGPKRSNFSQVKRALGELGIQIIFASSAQAKGRVERLFNTFQDRLIPEMRLRKIQSYQAANYYLQEQFLPNYWNKEKVVVPRDINSAYQQVPSFIDLKEIFCLKEYRQVASDHTISWDGKKYRITSPMKYSIHKQKIEIRTYQNLTSKYFFADKEIDVELIDPNKKLTIGQLSRSKEKLAA